MTPSPKEAAEAAPVAAVRDGDKLADGGRLLIEWLGEGAQPVEIKLAQARLDVCLTCPGNSRKTMWSWLSAPVAATVLAWSKHKHQMKLHLKGEENAGTCRFCLCDLKLKPWVPLEHFKAHTSEALLNELPDNCWLKKEIRA